MSVRTESPIFDALWDEFIKRDAVFEGLIADILQNEEKVPAADDTVEFVPSFPIDIFDEEEAGPAPAIFKDGEIQFNLVSSPVVPWHEDEILAKPFTVTIDTTTQHVPFFTPITKLTLSDDEIHIGSKHAFVNDLPDEYKTAWRPRTSSKDTGWLSGTEDGVVVPHGASEGLQHHYIADAWAGTKNICRKVKSLL